MTYSFKDELEIVGDFENFIFKICEYKYIYTHTHTLCVYIYICMKRQI